MSSVNWFCKETKYCACSHSEKCSPTALEESLVACSFKRSYRKASLCHADICVTEQYQTIISIQKEQTLRTQKYIHKLGCEGKQTKNKQSDGKVDKKS